MTIVPELLVEDLAASIDFYQKYLGFDVTTIFPEENPFFTILDRGQARIMLYVRKQFAEEIPAFSDQPVGGSFVLYIKVRDLDSLYKKMKRVTKIVQELHKTTYGTIEFTCEDPNGYKLMFAGDQK